jgi:hypothetical protein
MSNAISPESSNQFIQCGPLDGKSTAERIHSDFSEKYYSKKSDDKIQKIAYCVIVELDHEDIHDSNKAGTLRWLSIKELQTIKNEIGKIKFSDNYEKMLKILNSAVACTDDQEKKKEIDAIRTAFEQAPMQRRNIDPSDPKTRFQAIKDEPFQSRNLSPVSTEAQPSITYPDLKNLRLSSTSPVSEAQSTQSLYPKLPKQQPRSPDTDDSLKYVKENILRLEQENLQRQAQAKQKQESPTSLKPPEPVRTPLPIEPTQMQLQNRQENSVLAAKQEGPIEPIQVKQVPVQPVPAQPVQIKQNINAAASEKTPPSIPEELKNRPKKPYGNALAHNMNSAITHRNHLNHSFIGLYLQRSCGEAAIDNLVQFLPQLSKSKVAPYKGYFDRIGNDAKKMEKALYLLEKMSNKMSTPMVQTLIADFAVSVKANDGVRLYLEQNRQNHDYGSLYQAILKEAEK